MKNEENIEHESIGSLTVTKVSSNVGIPFVGSELLHNQYINLKLHSASLRLTDSQSYIYPGRTIVSLKLTLNQWAEFVSSIGNGMGTPCTLQYRPISNEIKECESPQLPSKFEFRNDSRINQFKEITESVSDMVDVIKDSKLSKQQKDSMQSQLHQLKLMLNENFEYFRQVIQEDMQDVIVDAKKNLESYAERLGINQNVVPQITNFNKKVELIQSI